MPLTSKIFSDVVTLTRSTTATYTDFDGIIKSAAIDTPRFEYDPFTGEALGLLKEPAITNSWPDNNPTLGAAFQLTGDPVAAALVKDPMGGSNTVKLNGNTVNSDHGLEQYATFPASSIITFSVFAKDGGDGYFTLDTYTAGNLASFTNFDLENELVTIQDGTIKARLIKYKNGWYRCSISFLSNSGGAGLFRIKLRNGGSYIGDDNSGMYFWGAQIEDGNVLTSVIPTTGGAAVRAFDQAAKEFTSVPFSNLEGSFYCEANVGNYDAGFQRLWGCYKAGVGAAGPSMQLFNDAIIYYYYGNDFNAGGVGSLGPLSSGTRLKFVVTYSQNPDTGIATVKSKFNNAAIITQTTGGDADFDAIDYNGPNANILDLKYYPVALSDAEMTAMTAI